MPILISSSRARVYTFSHSRTSLSQCSMVSPSLASPCCWSSRDVEGLQGEVFFALLCEARTHGRVNSTLLGRCELLRSEASSLLHPTETCKRKARYTCRESSCSSGGRLAIVIGRSLSPAVSSAIPASGFCSTQKRFELKAPICPVFANADELTWSSKRP
eukprot:2704191-Amphidinium_carterae.1